MARLWQKTAISSWNFDIYNGLRQYLCSKRYELGSYKQATHRRRGDDPFFNFGSTVHDPLESFWAHLDPLGPFQTRIDILLQSTSAKPYFVHLGQKNHFCLKWSKRVQMGPKGFQMVKNT